MGRQRGFTLVEALITLLVMSFGMLALSGMQLSLSRNADAARQRTEAMRLAQARIEQMRSFTGISTGAVSWNGLDAMADTRTTTNTTYTVSSTMSGADTDALRPVNVQVIWTDRAGATQSLNVATVISKTDPRDPGVIGNPLPLNTALKRPMNRSINIPIPALDLGRGNSATQFDTNTVIVYSNLDAGIVKICDPNTPNATIAQINFALTNPGSCTDAAGYILSGYIGRDSSSLAWPIGIITSGISADTGSPATTLCLYGDATDQGTGAVITANNGYKAYLCAIYRSPALSTFTWSGRVKLGGVSTTGSNIVCRYQYTQTWITSNEQNIQPYVVVNRALDEQNYLMTTSSSSSTSSLAGNTAVCPASMTVSGVSVGVVHQDCRLTNTARATECP